MFKSIIAAAVIATATFTTSASALTVQQCVAVGDIIESIAEGRDQGLSASKAFVILMDSGINDEYAATLIELVYITGKDLDGTTMKGAFIGRCVGETA
jgi:hypothetical protein